MLINCPECNKEISDKAISCPNCGYPINAQALTEPMKESEQTNCPESYNLMLVAKGSQPIRIIQIIRDITGMGLREAKTIVDNPPSIIVEDITYDKAVGIKQRFANYDAVLQIVSTDGETIVANSQENEIRCPQCGSTQIQALNKGFGLGKAAAGGVLLGGVGILGGFIGSKKVIVTCLKCGKQWEAGKG